MLLLIFLLLREESSLVDVFALEILVNYLESLALAHNDEQARGRDCSYRVLLKQLSLIPFSFKELRKKISKTKNWVELKNKKYHSKVLLDSIPMSGHTIRFCP